MTAKKDELKKVLKKNVVTVNFKKKDESIRKMVCTLSEDYLPEVIPVENEKQRKAESPDTLSVWDLEKQAWRSFRVDSVIDFESNH
jgi:hypothetical protein